jgi:hypothetical protein
LAFLADARNKMRRELTEVRIRVRHARLGNRPNQPEHHGNCAGYEKASEPHAIFIA